jgi:uncharacterized membrane-anchored protein
MSGSFRVAAVTAAACALLFGPALFAQDSSETDAEPSAEAAAAANPGAAAWQAAQAAMQHGPQTVTLRDQAQLELPEGYGFVPAEQGTAVMDVMGNTTDGRFLGLIFPTTEDAGNWFVSVEYEESGYIKDDDAKEWDADELLDNLKEGTEAANAHRREIGVSEIEVTRWVETPAYDAATHQLVWSAEAREKSGQDPDPTVNYNTYVLGREGYISLNLITSSSMVESNKPAARELLAAVNFNDGKRYSDFNASTDKVAAYGLAALVGGIAAKKLGLLAMIGVFFAKFAKLIIIAVAGAGAGIVKFFKGRRANSES